MLHFVYKLFDRRREGIKAVFYIGITDNPNERLERHIRCDENESEQKNVYIRDMLAEGVVPKMEIIEIIDDLREVALARETFWIKDYAQQGAPLLNNHHHSSNLPVQRSKAGAISENWVQTFTLQYRLEREIEYTDWSSLGSIEMPTYTRVSHNWLKSHDSLYWLWGSYTRRSSSEQYKNIWSSLGMFPLDEAFIQSFIRTEVGTYDIQSKVILPWESGHHYSCLVVSALYRKGKQQYQANVFQHALVSLASRGIFIDKIYVDVSYDGYLKSDEGGQAAPDGMYLTRLAKENYFTPAPTLSPTAWITYPGKHSLSRAIQAYQKQVYLTHPQ